MFSSGLEALSCPLSTTFLKAQNFDLPYNPLLPHIRFWRFNFYFHLIAKATINFTTYRISIK